MARIAKAREMRKRLTPPEARLWLALRALRPDGFHFRRQVPLQCYFADFACLKHRLVVEVDGAHHDHPGQRTHDKVRDAVLAGHGFRTLRFTNADVRDHLDWVIEAVLQALHSAAPTRPLRGHPPPSGEGESC